MAIDSGPTRDLYMVLTQLQARRHRPACRCSSNPLVLWLWVAGAIIALGGLIAAWPGPPSPRREPAASAAAEARGGRAGVSAPLRCSRAR